nr:PREDICTED: spermatogenesis-associated protein 22 isoform X2 [Lepisosteus oculatus]
MLRLPELVIGVSRLVAAAEQPFAGGELIQQRVQEVAEEMCPEKRHLFQPASLSARSRISLGWPSKHDRFSVSDMKRTHSENPPRPTAGCLSVPLFNQKKRNRLPLTSNPSEDEFYSRNEYSSSPGFPSPSLSSAQNTQWTKQGCQNTGPNVSSRGRGYAPLPHPGKTGSKMGQQDFSSVPWRDPGMPVNMKQNSFPSSSGNIQSQMATVDSHQKSGFQSFNRQSNLSESFHQKELQRQKSSQSQASQRGALGLQNPTWQFKAATHSTKLKRDSLDIGPPNTFDEFQNTPALQTRPIEEKSLRILTTVAEGMKHWSQYSDKAALLFEVFATLDSPVTTGPYGSKNFLLRDGKDIVQCVFYETDRELPRLIRGQVQRCVGNYDKSRNLLKCVSVRPATQAEQKNCLESVKASDAEMRQFVKMLREI